MSTEGSPENIMQINEHLVKSQLGTIVRETVKETLNHLLDEDADQLCHAGRYEHSDMRMDTRAGHYERSFTTTSGT